jgi:hypothetical protein
MSKYSALRIERPKRIHYGAPRNYVHVMREEQNVSVTDLWRSAGVPDGKSPEAWRATARAARSIEAYYKERGESALRPWRTEVYSRADDHIAHWRIALDYAKFIDPELHKAVVHAFREWSAGKPAPDRQQSADPGVDSYLARGYPLEWAELRAEADATRESLVREMTARCDGGGRNHFAAVTDAVNRAVLGGSARQIRVAKGLHKAAPIRDFLDGPQLINIRFVEGEIERRIVAEGASGKAGCVECARRVTVAFGSYRSTLVALESFHRSATARAASKTRPALSSPAMDLVSTG